MARLQQTATFANLYSNPPRPHWVFFQIFVLFLFLVGLAIALKHSHRNGQLWFIGTYRRRTHLASKTAWPLLIRIFAGHSFVLPYFLIQRQTLRHRVYIATMKRTAITIETNKSFAWHFFSAWQWLHFHFRSKSTLCCNQYIAADVLWLLWLCRISHLVAMSTTKTR